MWAFHQIDQKLRISGGKSFGSMTYDWSNGAAKGRHAEGEGLIQSIRLKMSSLEGIRAADPLVLVQESVFVGFFLRGDRFCC